MCTNCASSAVSIPNEDSWFVRTSRGDRSALRAAYRMLEQNDEQGRLTTVELRRKGTGEIEVYILKRNNVRR